MQNEIYTRNGPVLSRVGNHNFRHCSDVYATLVKLQFENERSIASHRKIKSEAYKATMEDNKPCYRELSKVRKASNFLSYIGELANGWVICLTETQKESIMIDPTTLKTFGTFIYTDSLMGWIHCARSRPFPLI